MYSTGIGKTTFANEICLKWAKDTDCFLSNDYDLVILIRLRAVEESSLQQVMIDAVGSEAAYDELLTKSHGNRCLIILEGLDEISAHWRQNDTMFCQLIKTTTFLSHANILVTSRPHACIQLHGHIKNHTRKIEIVGFDKPQIKEYAELYFHNSNTAEKFMLQINNNPHISSLCYVPLCLNMVLECFKYNNETLHTTLTELYQSFIISKVDEHIHFKKHTSLGTVLESDEQFIEKLVNVLSDVPDVLSKEALETMFLLSKLAYKSYFEWSEHVRVKTPKIIYTKRDLAHCNITNSGNDACGLLKATNTLFATGNTAVYTFNHLSVQEYFCALYISLQPENQQLQLLKDHITDYPHMWPFYAGLTKLRSLNVLQYLCEPLLHNKRVESYMTFSHSVSTEPHHNYKSTIAMKSIYEAQFSLSTCKWEAFTLHITGCFSLRAFDYLSIAYFMSTVPITHLVLLECYIGDQGAEMLASCKVQLPSLKVLDLTMNGITHKGMESVVTMVKTSTNLTHFIAAHNPIGDVGIQSFSLLKFEHLIRLNIGSIMMTEVGACTLAECLKLNPFQSLIFDNNKIKDIGLTGILNHLTSTLVQLKIYNCNLTNTSAMNIGKILKINESLKCLDISNNPIGDDGISALSDGLHVNTTLIQLVVHKCEVHSEGAKTIAKMLQANKTLKYLNISNNCIGDDGTTTIVHGIQDNTILAELNISSCDFHSKGTESIGELLRVNKTLKHLDISSNHIGDDVISVISCGLQANTILTKLKISNKLLIFERDCHAEKFINKKNFIQQQIMCTSNWRHNIYTYGDEKVYAELR